LAARSIIILALKPRHPRGELGACNGQLRGCHARSDAGHGDESQPIIFITLLYGGLIVTAKGKVLENQHSAGIVTVEVGGSSISPGREMAAGILAALSGAFHSRLRVCSPRRSRFYR